MLADTLYATYARKPGSQHIASLNACRGLEELVRRYHPRRVLEIGSGIGTLTDLLTQTLDPDAALTTVEDHPFCLEQMTLNLGPRLFRALVVHDLGAIQGEIFDLVIVDGGRSDGSAMPFVAHRGLVFVEGFRGDQRKFLEVSTRSHTLMNIRAMHRGFSSRGAADWGGAYWVYRFEPTLVERARFSLRYLWDGVLVGKRRLLHDMWCGLQDHPSEDGSN